MILLEHEAKVRSFLKDLFNAILLVLNINYSLICHWIWNFRNSKEIHSILLISKELNLSIRLGVKKLFELISLKILMVKKNKQKFLKMMPKKHWKISK